MYLHRVTPDPFLDYSYSSDSKYLGQAADNFKSDILRFDGHPAVQVVVARFNRFGGGNYRKSDYEVLSDWQDIEDMIVKFCDAGHAEALALQKARQLADVIKSIGWKEPAIKDNKGL